MVEAAEKSGALKPGDTIIEPTSGNTGVGLAMVAAVKGYKLILVMPDSMSVERRRLMLAYGASFDLTPREKGMKGAIARANELSQGIPGSWIPQQFENPVNIDVHVHTTAQEILADFPNGIDALITGVGTGGHISGCAKVLKSHWPQLKVYAVEPSASPVISGGAPAPHPIQGIGAGFIPTNLKTELLDGVIQVDAEPARESVAVTAKTFPETKLVVEEELANPDKADREKIDADNKAISEAYARGTNAPHFMHAFKRPPGSVTSVFGEWRTFNDGHRAQHLGLDLGAHEGAKVAAIDDGTVVLVRETFLAGNVVVIAHGAGICSLYFHLSKAQVAEGDAVKQGAAIGLAGHTGRTTGPHLHISMHVGDAMVDPAAFFKLAIAPAKPSTAAK